jgi:hypothetical protein
MVWLKTYFANHFGQTSPELLFVGIVDGADLVVVTRAENGAEYHLVGAHLALAGAVEIHYIAVNILRDDWGTVLSSVGA